MSVELLAKRPNETGAADDGDMVPLPRRRRRPKPTGRYGAPIAVADWVIETARADYGLDLQLTRGDMYIREDGGPWRVVTRTDEQMLRVLIQQGAEILGDVRIPTVQASWKRLLSHPRLFIRDVPQACEEPPAIAQGCPVSTWAQSMLVRVDLGRVARRDMVTAFRGWWKKKTGDEVRLLSGGWFYPRLLSARPDITAMKIDGVHYFAGAHLTDEALEFWRQQSTSLMARHGGWPPASIATVAVNRTACFSQRKVRAVAAVGRVHSLG